MVKLTSTTASRLLLSSTTTTFTTTTIPTFLLPNASARLILSTSTASFPLRSPTHNQTRHASRIARPRQPYHFTQLIQLSDGSTYTVRSTSPQAMVRTTKDSRNHVLWQPSNDSLRNVEVDEAGKLAAFRTRFGRAWDINTPVALGTSASEEGAETEAVAGDKGDKGDKGMKNGSGGGAEVTKEKLGQIDDAVKEAAAQGDGDPLADLIGRYVREEKNIPQGRLDGRFMGGNDKKKGKK